MRTLSSVRRSLVNLCAFLLVLGFLAAFMGLGTRQVNHSRKNLQRTVAQLQVQGTAR
jgi:cytochrome oxidase assembly protein ShyY1